MVFADAILFHILGIINPLIILLLWNLLLSNQYQERTQGFDTANLNKLTGEFGVVNHHFHR